MFVYEGRGGGGAKPEPWYTPPPNNNKSDPPCLICKFYTTEILNRKRQNIS